MCGEFLILRIERGKERKGKSTITPTEQDTTRRHSPTTRRGDGGCAESMRLVDPDGGGLMIEPSCIGCAA